MVRRGRRGGAGVRRPRPGIQFAYIKATEGTSYKDPRFNANYVNSYNAGV
ncbi:GH25 family lysozyme, partial [Micromonospora sp. NPDC051296]